MKPVNEIFEILKKEFDSSIISSDDSCIITNPFMMDKIAWFLKKNEELSFDSLMCLSGVEEPKVKNSDKTDSLSVYYHLHSIKLKHKLTVKTIVPKSNPEVESVENIWKCAGWHEREAFDLLGIKFIHHPDMRRILLPDDWEGYPLRKDYKAPEFYNGMKVTD
ncbi:MAG: NADH-quinone oxidoreductase subunit C [Melioribacteraceae bacterium]|nr:NADH-quinone oxidoreductase subunit C [Melioribacteraceae bacterium]